MPKMEYICPWNEVWAIYIYTHTYCLMWLSCIVSYTTHWNTCIHTYVHAYMCKHIHISNLSNLSFHSDYESSLSCCASAARFKTESTANWRERLQPLGAVQDKRHIHQEEKHMVSITWGSNMHRMHKEIGAISTMLDHPAFKPFKLSQDLPPPGAPKIETFRGVTGTLPPGPTPPAPTQLNPSARTWIGPDFDLISTWFGPEITLFRSESGRNRVEIRSGRRGSGASVLEG